MTRLIYLKIDLSENPIKDNGLSNLSNGFKSKLAIKKLVLNFG